MSTVSRPLAFRLVTPPDWWRIDLEPSRRAAAIDQLTRRQFAGLDHAPIERRQLVDELTARAEQAYQAGGIQLHLSTLVAGALPLSSSLVVSFTPGFGDAMEPHTLADEIAATRHGQVVSSTVEELPSGPAVRRVARLAVELGDGVDARPGAEARPGVENDVAPSLSVDWHLPVPGADGAYLTLAFGTPIIALEDALTELFDTIASTFAWVAP